MARELREHKSSFIVFSILRILVLVVLVRQIMLANYEGAFFCILTLLLLYVPSWIQVKLRIELPPPLEITIFCFIFAAEILGEVNAFYVVIPGWDTMLHTINGFLAAGSMLTISLGITVIFAIYFTYYFTEALIMESNIQEKSAVTRNYQMTWLILSAAVFAHFMIFGSTISLYSILVEALVGICALYYCFTVYSSSKQLYED